jgi:rhodanese-related sulfurtransferase
VTNQEKSSERRLEFISQNILLVLLALASGGALLVLTVRASGAKSALTPTQATLLINREDAQVIDIRGADDYVGGHLPDSRNIPVEQFETRAGEIDKLKEMPVILVCQNGMRSVGVCKQLEKRGFGRVSSLAGGISGWRAAGLPLRKGAKK